MVLLDHRADTSVVLDQSLLDGKSAPWSPLAWRSFKMSRMPSSLGAESQAMSVALGFIEWATLFDGADSRFVRFAWCSSSKSSRETSSVCYRLHESVRACAGSWEPHNIARQEVCRRRAHYSRVFEENGLCDTLGTYWFAIGRRAHQGQGRGS